MRFIRSLKLHFCSYMRSNQISQPTSKTAAVKVGLTRVMHNVRIVCYDQAQDPPFLGLGNTDNS